MICFNISFLTIIKGYSGLSVKFEINITIKPNLKVVFLEIVLTRVKIHAE